jgi:hypothetical protein
MKEWFLGRGQTLISLVVTIVAVWGSVAIAKRYPADASTWLVPVLATLTALATGLGRALIEPKKEDPK